MSVRSLSAGISLMVLAAFSPVLLRAQEAKSKPEVTSESAISPYERASRLVQSGRNLEAAIKTLSSAVEKEPDNAEFRMTLGCAYASRLASVSYVSYNAEIAAAAQEAFKRRLKVWRLMQSEPEMPLFGLPEPVSPQASITPDDGRVFTADKEKRNEIRADLARKALLHLRKSVLLSAGLTPKTRAKIDFACGWGMLLLYRNAKDLLKMEANSPTEKGAKTVVSKSAPLELKSDPAKILTVLKRDEATLYQDEIVACFKNCADFDKKKSEYPQSLAFAYAPDFLIDSVSFSGDSELGQSKINRIAEAIQAMRQALTIRKQDPDLLFQASLIASIDSPEDSLDFMRRLTLRQNQNSLPFYFLADAYLKSAEKLTGKAIAKAEDAAISALEEGFRAPDYRCTPLACPLPPLLRAAWAYRQSYGFGYDAHCLDSVFSDMKPAVDRMKLSKEGERLMRLSVGIMEMGLKALHNYAGADLDAKDLRSFVFLHQRAFYGFICCLKGFNFMKDAAKLSTNEANLSALAHYSQLEPYWKSWDAAITSDDRPAMTSYSEFRH